MNGEDCSSCPKILNIGNICEGAGETPARRLKILNGSGFQPSLLMQFPSWGFAPDWYDLAPSALKPMVLRQFKRQRRAAISAWGNAPGKWTKIENKG